MTKFVKEQLMKVHTPLPEWDDSTTQLIIRKGQAVVSQDIQVGMECKIQVEDYVIHPSESFTLAANWNGGTNPPEHILNCRVIQLMGKMVKVDAVGEMTGLRWEGWLPRKCFKFI